MTRFLEILLDRKVKVGLLFIVLVLLPISLIFTAWLTDFGFERWSTGSKEQTESLEDTFTNLRKQFKETRCPAKIGHELRDYWKCVWSTSITREGKEQHRRFLLEDYVNTVYKQMEETQKQRMMANKTEAKRRVRRQAGSMILKPFNETDPTSYFTYQRMDAIYNDIRLGLKHMKMCQQEILPGKSVKRFLRCVQEAAAQADPKAGRSLHSTFLPSTFPPLAKSEYDPLDFKLLKLTDPRNGSQYPFAVDFKPLADEEKPYNFKGADPYLEDEWSTYRYKFNNLNIRQELPAWTYRGKPGSDEWHTMNLEQFYVPLKKDSDVTGIELIPELAQTYPGIGGFSVLKYFDSPLEFRWTKDSGYFAYTRFLLPFLDKDDIIYYKYKNLIGPEVTELADAEVIENIILGITAFENLTVDTIEPTMFPDPEDAPFSDAYLRFIAHFFGIDTVYWISLKKLVPEDIHKELDIFRQVLRAYADAAKVQEACVKLMVDKYEYRLESETEIKSLIAEVGQDNGTHGCFATTNKTVANSGTNPRFTLFQDNMRYLYDSYFDRKEARQRFSLPKYPLRFPICRHNDPSPIDILTERSRQSSLRDYSFGSAAYSLNRFFMFYPLDAAPLLTVGIVDGERLDFSSVLLTGGAVKGGNLTFQYMHIHFARAWDIVGSEHWINGKGSPMELQMVFTVSGSADNIKYWHILARVQNQLFQFREKLVIILSVLVDVLETDDLVQRKIKSENLNQDPYLFEPFAQAAYHFSKIPQRYSTYSQPRGYVSRDPVFRFIDFIPQKGTKFYTYRGSLSWPPCFGYVIWSVYEQRLYMSKRQFDQFTLIPAEGINTGSKGFDNFRRFSDIHVDEEHDPFKTYEEVQDLIKARTIDRYILVGYHDDAHDSADASVGVVGEEEYYASVEENSANVPVQSKFPLLQLIMLVYFIT